MIYCNQDCQKMHWFTHKKVCKKLQEQRETQEEESAKLRMQQTEGAFVSKTQMIACYRRMFHNKRGKLHSDETKVCKCVVSNGCCVCVSDESAAVQEAADSIQELSVENNSKVAPLDVSEASDTPSPPPAAADNWGPCNRRRVGRHLLQETSILHRQRPGTRTGPIGGRSLHIYYGAETLTLKPLRKVCGTAATRLSIFYVFW